MATPGAVAVLALSAVMFGVSFCAGTVPLVIPWNHKRTSIISSLGVGLLVGTSLGVVLPEGLEMLYTSVDSATSHGHHHLFIKAGYNLSAVVSRQATIGTSQPLSHNSYHLAIAVALVSGYLVMHILTFLPPLLLARTSDSPIPLSALPSSPRLERAPAGLPVEPPSGLSNTTIGLCIHALADGIALGSSAVSDNLALEGIVFLAIMLHKVVLSKTYLMLGTGFVLSYCHTPTRIISPLFH